MLKGGVWQVVSGTSPTWMSASSLQGRIYGVSRKHLPHADPSKEKIQQIYLNAG